MMSILLIDDHSVFAKIFAAYLLRTRFRDCTSQHATNISIATEYLEKQAFDLIVLDNRIPPHFNYLESIRLLVLANWSGPILLMSGEAIPPNPIEQVSAFLLKDDLNEHTLEQAIEKCINI